MARLSEHPSSHLMPLCSSAYLPLSLKGPKGEGDQGGEGSPVGPRGIGGRSAPLPQSTEFRCPGHLHYLNPRAILLPRPPTSHLGAHHNAGSKESHEPHKPTQAPSQPSSIPPPGPRHAPPPRLLSLPHPVLHPNTHYKRCPKAQRLGLRSDQSPPRPLQGRSPDKSRHALIQGPLPGARPTHRAQRFRPVRRR